MTVIEAVQDQGQAIVAELETSGPPDGCEPSVALGPAPNLYLSRGADVSERHAEPWVTPLALAAKGNHREVFELLHVSGAK